VTIVDFGYLLPVWQIDLQNEHFDKNGDNSFRMNIDQRLDIYTTYIWTGKDATKNKLTVRQMT
jgi:hypothetical protein